MSADSTYRARGDEALAVLARVARREGHGEAPEGEDARGRERVLAALRGPPRAARRTRAAWVAALAAAAALVAFVAFVAAHPPATKPLRLTVGGVPTAPGSYLHASASGPAEGSILRFSDGSEVDLAPGASGRVNEIGPLGARVSLETGRASFSIAHLPGATWTIEAGPFSVAVLGTVFDASWSVESQELEVNLRAGEVLVSGPLAPGGVHLVAGQRLTARLADGELRIGALRAAGPPQPPSPPAVAAVSTQDTPPEPPRAIEPPPAPRGTAAPSAVPATTAGLGWPTRVATGDFLAIVREAEARGVDGTLRQVALADLGALADAARYASRPDLARRALLAERTRFPASPEARAAAFLLGRIADDGGDSADGAVTWYDTYLSEAPRGAFAAEALGRKLAALRRTRDARARAVAEEYLRRYPDGPHAQSAREVTAP